MAVLEFAGQSSQDAQNISASTARLINCFREPTGSGRFVLRQVPGEQHYITVSEFSEIRAMVAAYDNLYAAANGSLWEIAPSGGGFFGTILGPVASSSVGTIPRGEASLSSNNGRVTVVAGGEYYTYSPVSSSFSGPLTGAFTSMGSVEYLAGYTLISELDGRRIQWSALATPSSLPALNFASAEQNDQVIVRLMVAQDALWVFKEASSEIWVNTGLADDLAFQYLAGSARNIGLKRHNLAARMLDSIGFIGNDDVMYVTIGTDLKPISTPAVHDAIHYGEPTNVLYFEHMGHKFLCIRFNDRPAWVYNIATGEWHEQSTSVDVETWDAVVSATLNGFWYLGKTDGTLKAVYSRDGVQSYRRIVSKTLELEQPMRVKRLEFRGETAPELTTAPQLMLRLSGDGGRTWGQQRSITMGATGEYDNRMVFRALGRFRRLTAEVVITTTEDVPLYADAILELA